MSNNTDESQNFSITYTPSNNTSQQTVNVPNLFNSLTSSETSFMINSTNADILQTLLGNSIFSQDRNITPSPVTPSPVNITSSISEPNYNTSSDTSSLLTFSRNLFNNPLRLAAIENEISNNHAFALNNPLETVVEESASDEANQSSTTNTQEFVPAEFIRAIRQQRINTVLPSHDIFSGTTYRSEQNLDIVGRFFGSLIENVEEQIFRQVLHESFTEDQEKRLIDIARQLDIEKISYDDKKKEHKEFPSCRVCLNDYNNNDYLGVLSCKHFFHYDCIQEWGKRKPSCPYCDLEIPQLKQLKKPLTNK